MNEDRNAEAGEDAVRAGPHAEIVGRLLEYQRRLRGETGIEQPAEAEADTATTTAPEPDGAGPPPPEEAKGSVDARVLRERIARLDGTLARISAMHPLLRGEPDPEPDEGS